MDHTARRVVEFAIDIARWVVTPPAQCYLYVSDFVAILLRNRPAHCADDDRRVVPLWVAVRYRGSWPRAREQILPVYVASVIGSVLWTILLSRGPRTPDHLRSDQSLRFGTTTVHSCVRINCSARKAPARLERERVGEICTQPRVVGVCIAQSLGNIAINWGKGRGQMLSFRSNMHVRAKTLGEEGVSHTRPKVSAKSVCVRP